MMDGSVKRAETRESKEQKDKFKHIDDAVSIQPPKKSPISPLSTQKNFLFVFKFQSTLSEKLIF